MRRAWNGSQCFFFFSCLGNLGHPFHLLSPLIQRLLRVWWHHEELLIITRQHWLTDHTVHVSTTTQPYSSLILWTGTTRVGNVRTEQEEGRRTVERRGEGEEGNKMKHILAYAYICDWCLHNNTINNHYRHSHCLLNLVFTEKYGGMEIRKGSAPGEDTSMKATSCSQHKNGGGIKSRPICSSILIWPHESLTAVQLFILTQKPWFHHPSRGAQINFRKSSESMTFSLTWGQLFLNHKLVFVLCRMIKISQWFTTFCSTAP